MERKTVFSLNLVDARPVLDGHSENLDSNFSCVLLTSGGCAVGETLHIY